MLSVVVNKAPETGPWDPESLIADRDSEVVDPAMVDQWTWSLFAATKEHG